MCGHDWIRAGRMKVILPVGGPNGQHFLVLFEEVKGAAAAAPAPDGGDGADGADPTGKAGAGAKGDGS